LTCHKTFFARLSEEEIVISKDVKHNFKQVMVYAVHNDKLFSSYSGFLCEIKIFHSLVIKVDLTDQFVEVLTCNKGGFD
jgi:hypothetical protein